jgi:hypothetical protein
MYNVWAALRSRPVPSQPTFFLKEQSFALFVWSIRTVKSRTLFALEQSRDQSP